MIGLICPSALFGSAASNIHVYWQWFCRPYQLLTRCEYQLCNYFFQGHITGNVEQVVGDLFSCPDHYSLAHCISSDIKMGKGIAVLFKDKFGGVKELWNQGNMFYVSLSCEIIFLFSLKADQLHNLSNHQFNRLCTKCSLLKPHPTDPPWGIHGLTDSLLLTLLLLVIVFETGQYPGGLAILKRNGRYIYYLVSSILSFSHPSISFFSFIAPFLHCFSFSLTLTFSSQS